MAKYTNSLLSHSGESRRSRADKMSGWIKDYLEKHPDMRGKFGTAKKFTKRKNRMFLKNPFNWDKI